MNPSHCYSFPIQVHLALLFHFVFLPLFLAQPIQTQSIKIRLLNCIACAYWSRSRSEPSRNLKKCRKWPVSMLLLKLCLACERRNNNQQRNMFCIGTSCPTTTLVQRSMCIGRTHTHTHCAPLEISVEMNGTSFAVMVQLQIGCVIDSNVLRTNQQMKSNEWSSTNRFVDFIALYSLVDYKLNGFDFAKTINFVQIISHLYLVTVDRIE